MYYIGIYFYYKDSCSITENEKVNVTMFDEINIAKQDDDYEWYYVYK